MQRRTFLAAGGGALATGLAGCLGSLSGGDGLTVETIAVGSLSSRELAVQPTDSVVLLDFFATWCAPCKPQMAVLGSIQERFPEVHMLSITWEGDIEAIRSFWRRYEGSWPVASDTAVVTGQAYGVDNLPTMLVFDSSGAQVWRHTGLASESTVADALDSAGAGGRS